MRKKGETRERFFFLRRNKEGRKTFWGLVPEGSSHGCSITERASRAEVVRGLKKHLSDGQETSSIRSPTLITRSLSFGGPLFIACDFSFFLFIFFPFFRRLLPLHVCGWNGNFSHSSPFLTIVSKSEDQTEKNIIRPASRNRPRLHLLSSFV